MGTLPEGILKYVFSETGSVCIWKDEDLIRGERREFVCGKSRHSKFVKDVFEEVTKRIDEGMEIHVVCVDI